MRSLIKRPGEGWTVTEIQNELEPLQKAVGGHLEAVTLWADACVLCNEEGRIKGMPYNTTICGVSFVGPILIVGTAGEDFSDLTEQQEAALRAMGAGRERGPDELPRQNGQQHLRGPAPGLPAERGAKGETPVGRAPRGGRG